ncbi:LysE family translocator [Motiliproteus sp. MSK22-1]|uniref:LysE family translocator n=1 Tax=Motiliproteus sp. MSK22-1 TaxID=1897630 RepID=UPI0009759B2D|nr:LysE family translocator [Motiliproteus sp. MSK22-1]OMH36196.1 lysine transporter LysE [Motiliproteus sp. MSK22-1]
MFEALNALSVEFLLTALVVVLLPGTGVIYTLSNAIFHGGRASIAAALGCTLGIVPHLLATLLGLAALLHTSAVAFQVVKILGIAYLLYLAWGMWRETGALAIDGSEQNSDSEQNSNQEVSAHRGMGQLAAITVRGALINILNPKLSVFFLAFLPQFVPATAPDVLMRMSLLSATFMLMTFVVFVGYGLAANAVRRRVLSSARVMQFMQRTFAGAFAGFAVKLAMTER